MELKQNSFMDYSFSRFVESQNLLSCSLLYSFCVQALPFLFQVNTITSLLTSQFPHMVPLFIWPTRMIFLKAKWNLVMTLLKVFPRLLFLAEHIPLRSTSYPRGSRTYVSFQFPPFPSLLPVCSRQTFGFSNALC